MAKTPKAQAGHPYTSVICVIPYWPWPLHYLKRWLGKAMEVLVSSNGKKTLIALT